MDIFKPIQLFANLATYQWFGLGRESYLGSAFNFFIYDTIKIGLLLVVINYVMAKPATTSQWRKCEIS